MASFLRATASHSDSNTIPLIRWLATATKDEFSLRPLVFWAAATAIGIIAGFGAVVFRALIALFHNLFFLGQASFSYDANAHTPPGPWGPWVILAPVAGAMCVAFLVKNFAPEAKGHGVPEVMDAIYYHNGVIRFIVAAVKSVASAISIGSGGSVGREGPIIQIGATFGSVLGQFLRLARWQRITLIAAGTGGGIAATFNTPVGGVLFAVEIMMREVSARTLVPVAIATATATYVGQLFFGPHPSFVIPQFETPYFQTTQPLILASYAGLGILMGLVSALFIWLIYATEHFFENRIKGGYYVRHGLGMLLVGILFYSLLRGFGHYYIQGVGYATIQDILSGRQPVFYLLLLLFVLKLVATALTLGSGASGGIFSPALFLGATLGAAYGTALRYVFPALQITPAGFAVAAMGGAVAGTTAAAMAAIVMIFEMTRDYRVIIPMTITVALSYAVRRMLIRDSIYTRKLTLRGDVMPEALQTNLHFVRHATQIMDKRFELVAGSETVGELARKWPKDRPCLVVTGPQGAIAGVVTADGCGRAELKTGDGTRIESLARSDYVIVGPDASFIGVLGALRSAHASVALVVAGDSSSGQVQGVITERRLIESLGDAMDIFG